MRQGRPPLGLACPGCGSELIPLADEGDEGEVHRLHCRDCGGSYRARWRSRRALATARRPVGGLALGVRAGVLRLVPWVYRAGVGVGALVVVAAGGFVPVARGWLANAIRDPGGVVEAVGGIRVATGSRDPDSDFGPVLRRLDAPRLFEEVAEVARRLGVRPPEEVRLAFLPCCGVVAWRRSRALLLGLPLLHVLTIAELRAVLAHELAHLARGDATWSAGSLRFVDGLGRALDDPAGRSWGPLRLWARLCRRLALALVGPIARGQETRADRASAALAGGRAAASALVKVALVQPLFREVIGHLAPDRPGAANLYATFRAFWDRLPPPLLEAMRLRLLTLDDLDADAPHPPLADRVALVQYYPDPPGVPPGDHAALDLIGDPDWIEQMLHDRLYGPPVIEPSVFHRAGT